MGFRWLNDIKLLGGISEIETSGSQRPSSPGFPVTKRRHNRIDAS